MVHARDKYLALKRVVDYYPKIYAIIFCRTRLETQEIADKLIQDGYNAEALHGELSQQQRDLTMQKFRQHRVQFLVATDVAARGLDVEDLTHVINYGMPDDTESYTHRSGRTGRAGKKGTSICIINTRERSKVREVEKIIGKSFVKEELPSGKDICAKQLYKVIDDIERVEVDEEEIEQFLPEVYRKLEWLDKEELIKRVVSREFGRFLQYYANAPEIEEPADKPKGEKGKRGRNAEEGFVRLFLNLGKLDGFYAKEVMKLVNDHVKGKVEVGRIDLMKSFSFFEVAEEEAERVIAGLSKVQVKGRKVVVEVASSDGAPEDNKRKRKRKDDSRGGERPARGKKERAEKADKKLDKKSDKKTEKANKPSREERGYTAARGKKYSKDDWKQFFSDGTPGKGNDLIGEEPDFSEEGWARRYPKKKK